MDSFGYLKPLLAVDGLQDQPKATDSVLEKNRTEFENQTRAKIKSWFQSKYQTSIWDHESSFSITEEIKWPSRSKPSVLSPRNPSSELYPDGIIGYNWIQKYKEIHPSCLVSFVYLWEQLDKDPLSSSHIVTNLERDHDTITANRINKIKKDASKFDCRFLVVFMIKKLKPDSPAIIDRLESIRRVCGIEKSSTFLLNTFSDSGNVDMTASLSKIHRHLWELSEAYFKSHEKKTRKKRAKVLQGIVPESVSTTPLSAAGWIVRYDFKTAVFAELQQDYENSIKSYETSYATLIQLLNSSVAGGLLSASGDIAKVEIKPFTLRWVESRRLVDTICLRITKLYVLLGKPVEALYTLQRHIVKCKDFPEHSYFSRSLEPFNNSSVSGLQHLNGPLGGGSFVYWSWVSTQFKQFAVIIETAMAKMTKFTLPYPPPGSSANPSLSLTNPVGPAATNWLGNTSPSGTFGIYSSCNPMFTVQHAGYYFLTSARAIEECHHRYNHSKQKITDDFNTGLDLESSNIVSFNKDALQFFEKALEKEKEIDHRAYNIELLTRAYEIFKTKRSIRMTLYLASEIARLYHESGNYDMAIQFYEKISKTYRKEQWNELLAAICQKMRESAKIVGNYPILIESLIELLHPDLTKTPVKLESLLDDINTLLNNNSAEKLKLNMSEIKRVLQCDFRFQVAQGQVSVPQLFQIRLLMLQKIPIEKFDIQSLQIFFSEQEFNCTIYCSGPSDNWYLDCNSKKSISLDFSKYREFIIQGSILPHANVMLVVQKVIITLKGNTPLELIYDIKPENSKFKWLKIDSTEQPKWVGESNADLTETRIEQREPQIDLVTKFPTTCLSDEMAPFILNLKSNEEYPIRAFAIIREYTVSESAGLEKNVRFFLDQGAISSKSSICIDCGVISPQSEAVVSASFTASKPGEYWLKTSVYIQTAVEEFKVKKISPTEYDLSDTRLLGKEFTDINVKFKDIFYFNSVFSAVPSLPFPVEDIVGNVACYEYTRGLTRKYKWDVGVKMGLIDEKELFVEEISPVSAIANAPVVEIKWKAIGPTYIPSGKIMLMRMEIANQVSVKSTTIGVTLDPGRLEITWKRKNQKDSQLGRTLINFPKVDIKPEKIRVVADIPANIKIAKPFPVRYYIQNLTLQMADIVCVIESAEGFLFSGNKQSIFKILPFGTYEVNLNILPTQSGRRKLPRIQVLDRSDTTTSSENTIILPKKEMDKFYTIHAPNVAFSSTALGDLEVFVKP